MGYSRWVAQRCAAGMSVNQPTALVELAILPSERYQCSGHGPSLVNRVRRHACTARRRRLTLLAIQR
jgi:hypothetical protein